MHHRNHWFPFYHQLALYLYFLFITKKLLMTCKMITFDCLAVPKANHWIHTSTDYFSWGSVSASTHPLFMTIFFVEKLSYVLATISALFIRYKLYYLSPWSALPVTKLFFPTAKEKTGCPWTGEHMMESMGPLRHCDWSAISKRL